MAYLAGSYSGFSCRIAILNESPFKPLEDELLAEYQVNVYLIAGFTLPIVAALLQTALAYLYFRFGHAWSRVLNKYVGMKFADKSTTHWEENPLYTEGNQSTATSSARLQRSRTVSKTNKLKRGQIKSVY